MISPSTTLYPFFFLFIPAIHPPPGDYCKVLLRVIFIWNHKFHNWSPAFERDIGETIFHRRLSQYICHLCPLRAWKGEEQDNPLPHSLKKKNILRTNLQAKPERWADTSPCFLFTHRLSRWGEINMQVHPWLLSKGGSTQQGLLNLNWRSTELSIPQFRPCQRIPSSVPAGLWALVWFRKPRRAWWPSGLWEPCGRWPLRHHRTPYGTRQRSWWPPRAGPSLKCRL